MGVAFMNVSKLRNSTAIDKALGIAAVSAALKQKVEDNDSDQAQAGKPAQEASPGIELTADGVIEYLQRTSAISCARIDALISELRRLREKLVADGARIEQGIVGFATLNQSVVKLTEVVSDSVAHVEAPSPGE
jgi:hypothetical protein